MSAPFFLLRMLASGYTSKQNEADAWREQRDREALTLIGQGYTWREVADAAGFANPYIARLKKKYEATGRDAPRPASPDLAPSEERTASDAWEPTSP